MGFSGGLIVADENIPFVREAFGGFGEVVTLAGSRITPGVVRDAQVLILCPTARAVTSVLAAFTSGAQRLDTRARAGAWKGFAAERIQVRNAGSPAEARRRPRESTTAIEPV